MQAICSQFVGNVAKAGNLDKPTLQRLRQPIKQTVDPRHKPLRPAAPPTMIKSKPDGEMPSLTPVQGPRAEVAVALLERVGS